MAQIDPEDHLHWKFRLQRLDAEQIRDAVLKVSGRLDETIGASPCRYAIASSSLITRRSITPSMTA